MTAWLKTQHTSLPTSGVKPLLKPTLKASKHTYLSWQTGNLLGTCLNQDLHMTYAFARWSWRCLGILGFSACIATSWLQCWGVVELAVVSLLLKELGVVMFAVKSAFQSCIIGGADCATTMDTLEAVFMIWQTLHTCLHHSQPHWLHNCT